MTRWPRTCNCIFRARYILVFFIILLLGFISFHSWAVFSDNANYAFLHLPKQYSSKTVFPHPYHFIIPNGNFCTKGYLSEKDKLALIILVCTSPGNFLQRQAIRDTWGSISVLSNNTESVRVGFLIGKTLNSTLQMKIIEESTSYSDIIQEDFLDSYKNLTLKSVMLLKWVTSFCPNLEFAVKTDDDIFINITGLLRTTQELPSRSNIMYGAIARNIKPLRDTSSKWFVSETQFNAEVYPNYIFGSTYVMSRDIVPGLLEASYSLPFLTMEDVFIAGLCAEKAGVTRVDVLGFDHWARKSTVCSLVNAVTIEVKEPGKMYKIWAELHNESLVC